MKGTMDDDKPEFSPRIVHGLPRTTSLAMARKVPLPRIATPDPEPQVPVRTPSKVGASQPWMSGRTKLILACGVLFALLVVGSFLWADKAVYDYLHAHYNQRTRPIPPMLRFPTRLLRSLEDWGENVFVACVAFAMWQLDRTRRSRVVSLVLAAAVVAGGVEIVKRSVGRARPDKANGETNVELTQHFDDEKGDDHSFPSGHTAAAGTYGGVLSACYPPLTPVCIALTAGCGASRIWKERHFLSDCLVGGVFGWCVAWSIARSKRLEPLRDWFDDKFSVKPATA